MYKLELNNLIKWRKIGGFLKFFQILTLILTFLTFFSIPSLITTATYNIRIGIITPSYFIYSLLFLVIICVFRITYLVLLAKRNPILPLIFLITRIFAIAFQFVGFFIPRINFEKLITNTQALNITQDELYSLVMLDQSRFFLWLWVILSFLFLALIYIYFQKSKRYRIYTLPQEEYLQLCNTLTPKINTENFILSVNSINDITDDSNFPIINNLISTNSDSTSNPFKEI